MPSNVRKRYCKVVLVLILTIFSSTVSVSIRLNYLIFRKVHILDLFLLYMFYSFTVLVQRSPWWGKGRFLSKVSFSKYEFPMCQTHTKILLNYKFCDYLFHPPKYTYFYLEKRITLVFKQKLNKQHCLSHFLRLLKKRPSLVASRKNS